jgi:ABC-type transport system involved in multi-copper enzyme maturation permease subunit
MSAFMPELAEWGTFYVIVGAASGALIGLQFVVMTLIADRPPTPAAGAAFATLTIVHFGAALLLSALLRAPWQIITIAASLWGFIGLKCRSVNWEKAAWKSRPSGWAAWE